MYGTISVSVLLSPLATTVISVVSNELCAPLVDGPS